MAAINDNDSIISYGESIVNFGAVYGTTQESVKLQGMTIASIESQLNAMTHYCMALQQQSTLTNHAAQQQHGASINWHRLAQRNRNGGGGGSDGGYQLPACPQPGAAGQRPDYTPTLYKHFKNWNFCHTHGGKVDSRHTIRTCAKRGPTHNPNARTRTNMMNGLPVGLQKMILPSASGRTPHVLCQQHAPAPASWQQPLLLVNFTNAMV
jgi:hypothetical protein